MDNRLMVSLAIRMSGRDILDDGKCRLSIPNRANPPTNGDDGDVTGGFPNWMCILRISGIVRELGGYENFRAVVV